MNLDAKHLQKLTQTAISAAIKAGSLIALYSDANYNINYKRSTSQENKPQGGSSEASQIVTEVDMKSQEVILNELENSLITYDLAILTEEQTDNHSRFEKDYFWCIDPLDGTLPFTEKVAGYSVSIALISKEGEAIIGVIYDPKNDILYHATKGEGAYKNHLPIYIKAPKATDNFFLITDRSFVRKKAFKEVELALKQYAINNGFNGLEIIKDGGAAMNAMWVLEHSGACYFKFPKSEIGGGSLWDFAASACIFTECNAHVSTINQTALPLNKNNSTFMNDCGVIYATNQELANQIQLLYKKYGEDSF